MQSGILLLPGLDGKEKPKHRSHRIRTLVISAAALALAAPHATRADPKGKIVVSHLSAPLAGTTFAFGENIAVAGEVKFQVQATVGDTAYPVDPNRVKAILQQVEGIGESTGFRYQASGEAAFSSSLSLPNSFGFTAGFQLYPVDPHYPVDPTRGSKATLLLFLTVDVNAQGVATTASAAVTSGGGDVVPG